MPNNIPLDMVYRINICKRCGEGFVPKYRVTQKCCSKQCSAEYQRVLIKKICPVCNKEFIAERKHRHRQKFCSTHCAHAGKRCQWWRGGVTEVNRRDRNSIEYKNWRTRVFIRDSYTCRYCGRIGGKLVAHHIRQWSKFPKLRFVLVNGLTLCRNCHSSLSMMER